MHTQIWHVDAFTTHPYTGNPAAVMFVPEFFDDEKSLKIACEVNFAETAFLKKLNPNHYHIRWFSRLREVKLCGHATLAAAHILWSEGFATADEILLDSLSGPLKLYRTPTGYTLDFPLNPVGPILHHIDVQSVLHTTPLAVVQAADDILIEVAGAEIVRNLQVDSAAWLTFDCRAVIVTSACHDGKYDFISRLFAPRIGIAEDAVSAAAHCKLADYWQKTTTKSSFRAYQASKRGGEIYVEIVDNRVHLTGQAVTVMKGEWLV